MSYAANAVMAKVKAMYGKRLSPGDYDQLIQKKNVGEVASYLAHETCYADNLREVKEDLIHRELLENLVRRHSLDSFTKLLHYARGDRLFLTMYVMQQEIDQLLTVIRLFNSGHTDRYIVSLPVYLAKLMRFDLFALANVTSYDDLLRLMEHSEYREILGRFRPALSGKQVDITGLEAALLTHYYSTLEDIARKDYRGDARKDLERLFGFRVLSHNCLTIYRMRRYLGAGADLILPRLVRVAAPGDERLYRRLLDAPDLSSLYTEMGRLRFMKKHAFDWSQGSTEICNHMIRVRADLHRKVFRMSNQPAVVVASYMVLLDIEISNVYHIIEGIRYSISPAEIRAWLA